jgi:mucin-19
MMIMAKNSGLGFIGLLAMVLCVSFVSSSQAASLYFDPESSWGFPTWDTTTMAWGTAFGSAPDTIWNNANLDDAIFSDDADPAETLPLEANGITVHNITFNCNDLMLGGPGNLTLAGVNPTIQVTTAGSFDQVNTVILGVAGMTKTGSGTLNLTNANQFTGGVTVNSGNLSLLGGANRLNPNNSITVLSGTLNGGGNSQDVTGLSVQGGTVTNGTINNTGTAYDMQSGTVSAALAGAVGLNKTTTGTLTLSGANTYSGMTTIGSSPGGIVDLGATTQSLAGGLTLIDGTLRNGTWINTGAANYDLRQGTVSASLGQGATALGINKTTSGTLTLTGSNSFNGKSTISAGVVEVGNRWALGSPAAFVADNISLYGGATIRLTQRWSSSPDGLGNNGITLVAGPGGSNATIEYSVTSGQGMNRFMARITGNCSLTYRSITPSGGTYSGDIAGSGFWAPAIIGDLTTWPDPYNTYAGDIIVDNTGGGGTWVTTRGDNSFPFKSANFPGCTGNMVLTAGSGINMNGTNQRVNAVTGAGNIANWGNARQFVVGNNDTTFSFDGNVDGSLNGSQGRVYIGKDGSGTATFTGHVLNNALGGLKVYKGSLVFSRSDDPVGLGQGLEIIDVRAGATLDVSAIMALPLGLSTQTAARKVKAGGSVTGNLSLTGASGFITSLSPGADATGNGYSGTTWIQVLGTLTDNGNVTLNDYSDLAVDLQSPSSGASDKLNVTGALNLSANSTLTVRLMTGYTPALGDSFNILSWGSLSGTFNPIINEPTLSSGLTWDNSALYTTGTISVVPEPATWTMLVLAAMGLGIYWRRSR